jgi:hypothetical protein
MKGVVMIGQRNDENRRAIEHYGETPVVGWIPVLAPICRETLLDAYERYFDHEVL